MTTTIALIDSIGRQRVMAVEGAPWSWKIPVVAKGSKWFGDKVDVSAQLSPGVAEFQRTEYVNDDWHRVFLAGVPVFDDQHPLGHVWSVFQVEVLYTIEFVLRFRGSLADAWERDIRKGLGVVGGEVDIKTVRIRSESGYALRFFFEGRVRRA